VVLIEALELEEGVVWCEGDACVVLVMITNLRIRPLPHPFSELLPEKLFAVGRLNLEGRRQDIS